MPYISGDFVTFIPRLHQLAISGEDVLAYQQEGLSYTGALVTSGWIVAANGEFRKIAYELSGFWQSGDFI